jgi:hypothetical protein
MEADGRCFPFNRVFGDGDESGTGLGWEGAIAVGSAGDLVFFFFGFFFCLPGVSMEGKGEAVRRTAERGLEDADPGREREDCADEGRYA